MRHVRTFKIVRANFAICIFFALFCSAPGRAQEQNPSQSPATSQQPASEPASQGNEHKKTKKVWTNEDMGAVKASPVSEIGQPEANKPSSGPSLSPAAKSGNTQLIATYRKQLARLQAQQALNEKQLAELKDFNRGEPGHDTGLQLHKRYNLEPVDVQIRKLEDKSKKISDQIDALFDAARKKGIESGQLR